MPICTSEGSTDNYVPPLVGNGELSVMLDMEGTQRQVSYPGSITPMIWWAGRRYDTRLGELIPFGYVGQNVPGLIRWSPFTLTYTLAQPGVSGLALSRMRHIASRHDRGADIHFDIIGQEPYHGTISLLCDRPARCMTVVNRFEFTVEEAGCATFVLLFVDSMTSTDVPTRTAELKEIVRSEGYDGLNERHRHSWQAYWDESFVSLPWEGANTVYEVAQYHLRVSSTPWSLRPLSRLRSEEHRRVRRNVSVFSASSRRPEAGLRNRRLHEERIGVREYVPGG